MPAKNEVQRFAQKAARRQSHAGNFEKCSNNLAAKDKVDTESIDNFLKCLREVCGGSSQIRKKGSRAKGVAIHGSDWDYQVVTLSNMTKAARDQILECSQAKGMAVICNKAFTVTAAVGRPIDFFPAHAEWHPPDMGVQSPGAVHFSSGAKVAIKKLKQMVIIRGANISSYMIETLVLEIQREEGWNDVNDPHGERRFSEGQRRLFNS